MSDPGFSYGLDQPEILRQASRDRWAPLLATVFVVAHFLSCILVFGWSYYLVPRIKQQLDQAGFPLTGPAVQLILLSDLFVNYWYVPAFFGIPFLIADFLIMRWVGKQLGLTRQFAFGLCLLILILSNFAYSYSVLSDELARVQNLALQ